MEDTLVKFETYEDYLDSHITDTDRFYLEEEQLARQLVEIGCLRGAVLSREAFYAGKEQLEASRRSTHHSPQKLLCSSGKELSGSIVLRHLAAREDLVKSGKLSTIIFIRDVNRRGQEVSGYIDYSDRLKKENFEQYFDRKKRLLPRPSDLSYCIWDTHFCCVNDSANFQVIPDQHLGLLFKHKRDRKVINVDPHADPGDNSKRHEIETDEYIQFVIYDHMSRRRG
ncbi:flagellar/basal body protein [Besnoitia besnoiti]|uniref:Cilia- and flagella-associated protein 299 n=1 Tax=Besnoitia besnoiti TaxID=94643 RepID=A0A2A9M9W8_BESBE|nr:flagellar/basal body protein [Besnoitia besnoiti]PFH34785.1 flagellar/basal body protein [Besnoitia besnoiti]